MGVPGPRRGGGWVGQGLGARAADSAWCKVKAARARLEFTVEQKKVKKSSRCARVQLRDE